MPTLITLPTNVVASSVIINMLAASALVRAPKSFKTQLQRFSGQAWGVDFNLPVILREEAGEWRAFHSLMVDQDGVVLLGDTGAETPLGVATGTPTVSGSHVAGDNTLATTGWTGGSVTKILAAGDFLQVDTGLDSTLHMVQFDTDSVTGDATFTIWPSVRKALSGGETITVQKARGLFRLGKPQTSWAVAPAANYDFSFVGEEALDG